MAGEARRCRFQLHPQRIAQPVSVLAVSSDTSLPQIPQSCGGVLSSAMVASGAPGHFNQAGFFVAPFVNNYAYGGSEADVEQDSKNIFSQSVVFLLLSSVNDKAIKAVPCSAFVTERTMSWKIRPDIVII